MNINEQPMINPRPLYQLINPNLRPISPELKPKISSPSPSRILPAKQFTPFKPIILKKKSQVYFKQYRKKIIHEIIDLGTHWSI